MHFVSIYYKMIWVVSMPSYVHYHFLECLTVGEEILSFLSKNWDEKWHLSQVIVSRKELSHVWFPMASNSNAQKC